MKSPLVHIEKEGPHITILTLNRPERRNALNLPLMEELCQAVERAGREKNQRVLLIRGAGKAFCAGLDLREAMSSDPTSSQQFAQAVARTLITVWETPLVTIAVVHGAAVAGGAGLMSACDFAVAEERALIGYPEVKRGLAAAFVMNFLRRQVRERDLKELLLTGDLISAQRALEMGLVNRVVPVESLLSTALGIANKVLQGAPGAIASTKKAIDKPGIATIREEFEQSLAVHLKARDSEEAQEGSTAFLEKRPPNWVPDSNF